MNIFNFASIWYLLGLLWEASGYYTKGTVDTLSSWAFLDRFCFVPIDCTKVDCLSKDAVRHYGMFEYRITYPETANLKLEVYFQKSSAQGWDLGGWDAVYPVDRRVSFEFSTIHQRSRQILTCSDRNQFAAASFDMDDHASQVTKSSSDSKNMEITGYTYFKASTPKFFFVAIANCNPECACDYKTKLADPGNCTAALNKNCDGPLILDYEFIFTNGMDKSVRHFSADEIGILELSITFLALYTILGLAAYFGVKKQLQKQNKYHYTVRLLIYSIVLEWLGLVCMVNHLDDYSVNGVGSERLYKYSKFCQSGSDLLLVLMLVLIGKGWTIVRSKLSAQGRVKIAIFFTSYAIMTGVLRHYTMKVMDKGLVTYEYETGPGKSMFAFRAAAAVWFVYACLTTINNFPTKKRRFYRKFTLIFTLWFFLNILCIVTTGWVDEYNRAKFSMAWELSMAFVAHFILVVMYNPNLDTSGSFPFHSMDAEQVMGSKAKYRVVERPRRKSRRAKNYGWDADEPEENLAESDSNHLIGGGVIANASASSANSNALTTQQQEKLEQVRQRKVMIFGSVEQATEAVKDAGDSLSAILHSLVVNLDTLDDAMDDWDGSPEDEMGDEYADLEDEIDDGFNNRRVSRRGNL